MSVEEITSQPSIISQLSINTQLPTINDALKCLNLSPISTHKLTNQTYLENKISSVNSYLSTAFGLQKDSSDQIRAQEFLNMIDALKIKFHDKKTNKKEKIQILTSLPQDWSVNKVCTIMNTTRGMVKVSKSLRKKMWYIINARIETR